MRIRPATTPFLLDPLFDLPGYIAYRCRHCRQRSYAPDNAVPEHWATGAMHTDQSQPDMIARDAVHVQEAPL